MGVVWQPNHQCYALSTQTDLTWILCTLQSPDMHTGRFIPPNSAVSWPRRRVADILAQGTARQATAVPWRQGASGDRAASGSIRERTASEALNASQPLPCLPFLPERDNDAASLWDNMLQLALRLELPLHNLCTYFPGPLIALLPPQNIGSAISK